MRQEFAADSAAMLALGGGRLPNSDYINICVEARDDRDIVGSSMTKRCAVDEEKDIDIRYDSRVLGWVGDVHGGSEGEACWSCGSDVKVCDLWVKRRDHGCAWVTRLVWLADDGYKTY